MIGEMISHYKVLEKLGEGGMGVVYKAEDTKLDRLVALKFLPAHLVDDEKALSRLLKEAKSASKINHPNVCTIYAIEEYEDTHFIVMEFVDGQTVKNKIKDEPLSINETVEYSEQICKALKAAHDKGIIHRDIKSENIMINMDNMVKVMDFGLAKLKDEARLSRTSTTAGTIAYMAPEQIKGQDIDHRADIWAFGVVLFEMLTGKFPFKGEYESAMSYSIVNTDPEPITEFKKDIPFNLEQVIYKSLEKDISSRYQSIQEVLSELKKIPSITAKEPEQEKSIIVLPFVNMSPDPDQEYFSDGLTEEIITDLSHIHDLLVISRSSAMTFKGTKQTIPEIVKKVNVRYVLEGSVRKAGNNLRITAQLIDAATDTHLWAEKYSGTLDDIFDIQEKVSRSIVDALKVKLLPEEEKQIAERPIDNVQAYEYYKHAKREIYRCTEEGLNRAFQDLQLGLEIVGENTLLYKGMAEVYLHYYEYGVKADEETLLNAEKYANKITDIQPDSDDSYYLLGRIERFRGSCTKAAKYLQKAYAINPDNTDVLLFLGHSYGMQLGKTSPAKQLFKKLFELDPLTPLNYGTLGMMQMVEGQHEDALSSFQKWSKLAQDDLWKNIFSVYIYAWQKQNDKTYELVGQMVAQKSQSRIHDKFAEWCLFFKYALQGEKSKALETISEGVKNFFWNDPEVMWYGVCNYALINEKEEAFKWLEHIIDRGWINYPFLSERAPFLENIRGEERFKKLMVRVKHEWENFEV